MTLNSRQKGKRHKYNARKVWMCEREHITEMICGSKGPPEKCLCGSSAFVKFDSVKEANRWLNLRTLERAGAIKDLKRQLSFELWAYRDDGDDCTQIKIRSKGYPNGRQATWTADFEYYEDDKRVIEDVKGMDTPTSRLKRAIVEAMTGIQVRVT